MEQASSKNIKNITKIIIETILILIIASIIIFDIWCYVTIYATFFISIDDVSVKYIGNENSSLLAYSLSNINAGSKFEFEYIGNNIIRVKLLGKVGPNLDNGFSIRIDENIEHVYLEDKKGNSKEIWNKENGVLTEIGKSMIKE